MAHPLVDQLRFTRGEFLRALDGVPEEDGARRLMPMNSIGWIVGHMAWHEQLYWLTRAQSRTPLPDLNEIVRTGGPATTPSLTAMLEAWRTITSDADPWLEGLAGEELPHPAIVDGKPWRATRGSWLRRVTYHYWFHTGEILAIRQILGHGELPEFVGDLDELAPYRPESA